MEQLELTPDQADNKKELKNRKNKTQKTYIKKKKLRQDQKGGVNRRAKIKNKKKIGGGKRSSALL